MGDQGSSWLPDAMSSVAGEVDALFNFVLITSTILFAAVVISTVYLVIRFRRRSDEYVPEPVRESKLLEAVWIILPTVLTMIIFTWGFKVFVTLNTPPPDSYDITVRGKQWFWEFEYAEGVTVANDLYVPVGRPIKLLMSSDDVLHSFFVPEFRIKHDVIPNRYTSVWFEATEVGDYRIYCTEYCGQQHSSMIGTVRVVTQEEFDDWLDQQNQDLPPVELGARLVTQYNCQICHATDGNRIVGPPVNGLFESTREFDDGTTGVADDNYIRESIVTPGAKVVAGYPNAMPATFGSLSTRQIDGLVAYLKSLE